jgi:heme/copper-type cytochrome/quinol oxidase subunit 4
MFLGIWNGKCCGVMGVMEGMMAGFMGGLMGAMTAFMLLNDHLQLASLLVFLISIAILIGLNYMIYLETRESKRERQESHITTIILTVILMTISIYIMILGPRSAIFS